jgi:dihydrofolate reductase
MSRELFLVAAIAANGTIGMDGAMPWHLPADLRRFKSLTMGLPMVMGRKTFDSLPGLLPGRRHIVLTRDKAWKAEGAEVAHSLEAALALANAAHVAVIGGAEIYAQALPLASRLELTEIKADYPGDAQMPPLGPMGDGGWRETFREEHAAEQGRPAFAWVTLKRDL